jgi:hypothetical protein
MLEDSESSESDDDFNCNDEWWIQLNRICCNLIHTITNKG